MTTGNEQIDVFLQPGDLFVGDAAYRIRTMLGSCVSITLWHAQARVGGMSHFLLPARAAPAREWQLDGRYGDEALALMLRELRKAGVRPEACEAKIFGGGNMFPHHRRTRDLHIGHRNGQAARALLAASGIPVVSENLFGNGHRLVLLDVATGAVWMQQVKLTAQEAALQEPR